MCKNVALEAGPLAGLQKPALLGLQAAKLLLVPLSSHTKNMLCVVPCIG